MRQKPFNTTSEVFGVEGFGEVAGALVLNNIGQAAGIEGNHRSGAGVGFDADVGQIVLARGNHYGISGAVERAQAEVVVQVAGVVNGKTQIGRVARRELAEDHQL